MVFAVARAVFSARYRYVSFFFFRTLRNVGAQFGWSPRRDSQTFNRGTDAAMFFSDRLSFNLPRFAKAPVPPQRNACSQSSAVWCRPGVSSRAPLASAWACAASPKAARNCSSTAAARRA